MDHKSKNGIAKNTFALTCRMILRLIVSLYTTRVIMNALGIIDFGIYNVVAGISTMFTFVNTSMSSAISRFISFDIGRRSEINSLSNTFRICFTTQVFIAIGVLIIAEIIGIWLINYYLDIPTRKIYSANVLYQCTLISMVLAILQVPFNATIIAYERMTAYAYIEIVYVFFLLGIAFVLQLIKGNLLIYYGVMLVTVNIIIFLCYKIYCLRFGICKMKLLVDLNQAKPILKFSGADFYTSSCMSIQSQGVSIILNRFFGLIANAAAGVAVQIYSALLMFSSSITTAVRPRIIKYYANNDFKRFNSLIFNGSRIITFFNIVICMPILFCIRLIFTLWLENTPEYAVEFAQVLLINHSMFSYRTILSTALQATGKIEKFSIYSGSLYLFSTVIQFFMAKIGFPIILIYGFMIVISAIYVGLNIVFLGKMTNISKENILREIVLPPTIIALVFGFVGLFIRNKVSINLTSDIIFTTGGFISTLILSYIFVLNTNTRNLLYDFLKNISYKIRKNNYHTKR